MPSWAKRTTWAVAMVAELSSARILLALGIFLGGCDDGLSTARELEDAGDLAGAVALREISAERPNDLAALGELAINLLVLQEYDRALAYKSG